MRHNNKINALGRKSAHRKAMLSNMAASLILHKRIKTTVAKAKALRVYIEPIITKSKEDTTHARRLAFGYLQDKKAVTELFREVSPKVSERPGGYTRILKLGQRVGDAAEVCYIELVDFNETMLTAKAAAEAKTTRRSRRGSRKKADVGTAEKPEAKTVSGEKSSGLKEEKTAATDVRDDEPADVQDENVTGASEGDATAMLDESTEQPAGETTVEEEPAPEAGTEEKEDESEKQESKGDNETGQKE